jgi:hypothetical protein
VEPRGIFTTLIPTQVLLQPGSTPGAVPDAAIRAHLGFLFFLLAFARAPALG